MPFYTAWIFFGEPLLGVWFTGIPSRNTRNTHIFKFRKPKPFCMLG
jgi:hypothetical protein